MHASRLVANKEHGFVTFQSLDMTLSHKSNTKNAFGLGFIDDETGELGHHIWLSTSSAEHGPCDICWMAYQTPEQFLELMGVLRSLGDQIRLMIMVEPPHIQMQDLLREPLQNRMTTSKGKFETYSRSAAWRQNRINDLSGCLAQTHIHGPTTQFNLELTDPIKDFLTKDESWQSITGAYTVTFGQESSATPGLKSGLPAMKATVSAFTRMWQGSVRPISYPTQKPSRPPRICYNHSKRQ